MARTIDTNVATIRNNIYGKQIREAIASALEDTYDAALPKYTKLWENASPSSSFADQDISIATGYNLYLVFFKENASDEWLIPLEVYCPYNGAHSYGNFTYEMADGEGYSWTTAYRSVFIYPSTGVIHFNHCFSNGVPYNGRLIPWYVLGTKI